MRHSRLVIVVVLMLGLTACGGDTPSTDDADSGAASATAFFQDLESDWSIDRIPNRPYGLSVAFNGNSDVGDVVAEIGYPGYDCAGYWTLLEADAVSVTARETITLNPGDICYDGGLVHLVRSESSMTYEWAYADGEISDTATLFSG